MPRQGSFLRRARTPAAVADRPSPTPSFASTPQLRETALATDIATSAGITATGTALSLETPPALITVQGDAIEVQGPRRGGGGRGVTAQLFLNPNGAPTMNPGSAWLQRGSVNFNISGNIGRGHGLAPAVDLGDVEGEGEEEEFGDDHYFTGPGAAIDVREENGIEGREHTREEDEDEDEEDNEDQGDDNENSIEGDEEEELEGEEHGRNRSSSPLPPDLREISSLASWTVSTHKPGCGVAALRHPSPSQFWQSDGPQPHTLTLHFFKLVAIVKIRVYLDFELDESYTPTRMLFFAGMGGNDLVEFASWDGETPCGWIDISLEGVGGGSATRSRTSIIPRRSTNLRYKKCKNKVGGRKTQRAGDNSSREYPDQTITDESYTDAGTTSHLGSDSYGLHIDDILDHMEENRLDYQSEEGDDDFHVEDDWDETKDPYNGNVLKAMVVQVRICENHQNGKDTHVRGFQVFARDEDRRRVAAAAVAASNGAALRHNIGDALRDHTKDLQDEPEESRSQRLLGEGIAGLDVPDWMGEPAIR